MVETHRQRLREIADEVRRLTGDTDGDTTEADEHNGN
jgi:hypothetical protein